MTLICNNEIKSMNWNIQLFHIGVKLLIVELERPCPTKKIHCHALDGTDIYKRITQLRLCQQRIGHDIWIPLLTLLKVRLLEALGVHRVTLIKFQSRLGLKGGECPNRLRR